MKRLLQTDVLISAAIVFVLVGFLLLLVRTKHVAEELGAARAALAIAKDTNWVAYPHVDSETGIQYILEKEGLGLSNSSITFHHNTFYNNETSYRQIMNGFRARMASLQRQKELARFVTSDLEEVLHLPEPQRTQTLRSRREQNKEAIRVHGEAELARAQAFDELRRTLGQEAYEEACKEFNQPISFPDP